MKNMLKWYRYAVKDLPLCFLGAVVIGTAVIKLLGSEGILGVFRNMFICIPLIFGAAIPMGLTVYIQVALSMGCSRRDIYNGLEITCVGVGIISILICCALHITLGDEFVIQPKLLILEALAGFLLGQITLICSNKTNKISAIILMTIVSISIGFGCGAVSIFNEIKGELLLAIPSWVLIAFGIGDAAAAAWNWKIFRDSEV